MSLLLSFLTPKLSEKTRNRAILFSARENAKKKYLIRLQRPRRSKHNVQFTF